MPPRESLISLLQLAYSGELAAAYAYAGHWRATRDEAIRTRIAEIEQEELHHRACVGAMLTQLGAAPDPKRERRATAIGKTLGALCHVSGSLAPLWGAGKLERKNIVEYENAARFAAQAGLDQFIDELLTMAEVEWEHELFFREAVLRTRLGRLLPIWSAPPPKSEIRASFERDRLHPAAA
jgi:rubrerythrin